MANIELKLKINELKEYFFLLSNFFETLNYQLGVSKSDEFKNIEFKFIPEKCSTEFTLPIKLGGNFINSSDYGYAFKKHENKIYLVTLFGSFASSLTELKIEDLTNFVAKKLETSFKQSSDFYYSSISLSGLNEEINLNDSPLLYKLIPEDSKKVFEQFQNFDQSGRMSVELSVHFDKWYNDAFDNSTSPNATIYSSLTNLIYNTPSSYMITGTVVAISGFVYFSYCYFKNQKAQYEIQHLKKHTALLNPKDVEQIIENYRENKYQIYKKLYNKNVIEEIIKYSMDQINPRDNILDSSDANDNHHLEDHQDYANDHDNTENNNYVEDELNISEIVSFDKYKFIFASQQMLKSNDYTQITTQLGKKYQSDFFNLHEDQDIANMFIKKKLSENHEYYNAIMEIFKKNVDKINESFPKNTKKFQVLKDWLNAYNADLSLDETQVLKLSNLVLARKSTATNFKFAVLTEMFKAKVKLINDEAENLDFLAQRLNSDALAPGELGLDIQENQNEVIVPSDLLNHHNENNEVDLDVLDDDDLLNRLVGEQDINNADEI